MQVKVYRNGCDVEAHEIPPFVGKTTTWDGIDAGAERRIDCGNESESDADCIADIKERFRFSPDWGGVLERIIVRPDGREGFKSSYSNGTRGMVVIPPGGADGVIRITVDGEQVWPELIDSGTIGMLENQITELLSRDAAAQH